MGRQWERQDPSYACYSGFLHMEASKICFKINRFSTRSNLNFFIKSAHKSSSYLLLQYFVLSRSR
jgi:hypothetical protein